MKKPIFILLVIVGLAAAVYLTFYRAETRHAREMLGSAGDLEWLRTEFALSEPQVQSIAKLQSDYEPKCQEMCLRIAKSNERLKRLMQESKAFTPELEGALREASQTQADCRAITMAQAFAISAQMPPEQGSRYRAMIADRILPMPLTGATHEHH